MGILTSAIAAPEQRTAANDPRRPLTAASLLEVLGGAPSITGRRVSAETALMVTDVYKCVNVLAQSLASLPAITYERLSGGGKERATGHRLYRLLHDEPNPWMTAYTFKEALQGHLGTWGNAFAEIELDDDGGAAALYPLRPDRMGRPEMSAAGTLIYPYQLPDGRRVGLPQARVLHLRGLSSDGLWGYSPIADIGRDSVGLAKTLEEYAGRFFARNARPGGVLQVDKPLSADAAQRLKGQWEALQGGLDNAHRVAVLEEGVKWQAVGIPPNEAQHLESRKFQRADIAGMYRIPPHMIGDLERATFSNIEQQSQEFVTYTLGPWLVNWELQLTTAMLRPAERQRYFVEFLAEQLLRGDSAARGAFYTSLFNLGALSTNDIREKENMNPVEGGDKRFVPLNMQTLDQAGQPAAAPDQPSSPGDEAPNNNLNVSSGMDSMEIGRILLNIKRLEEAGETEAAQRLRDKMLELIGDQASAPGRAMISDAETRSAEARGRLREVYRPLLRDMAERIVQRQVGDIREAMPRLMGQRSVADFEAWLERYHADELAPFIGDRAAPVFRAYAAAVQREILDELKIPALPETLDPFLEQYLRDFVASYVGRSLGQLQQLARDAQAQGKSAQEAIEQRLTDWLTSRAGRVADVEAVRAESATSHKTYRLAGVTAVKWRTKGKNCPYCARLDGKTVRIDEAFVGENGEVDAGDGQPPMRISRRTAHPPLHRPCDCYLAKA